MARFEVTEEFRAFMRDVATKVDWTEGATLFEHECGRGEREGNTFHFTYFARDGHGRWEIDLPLQQLRDVAGGVVTELEGRELDPNTRNARGEALLVWGEYDDDALRVRSATDLQIALDGLHALSAITPLAARLWSTADEQLFAVLDGGECAVYVVAGDAYGTSVGDPTRGTTIDFVDHDVGAISIPHAHLVPWRIARPALLRFAEQGQLGSEVLMDGAVPASLMILGDFDRAAELQTRRAPPADPALSSLPRKAPHGLWAERLLDSLVDLQLLEIDPSIRDAIAARLAILLLQHGDAALDTPEAAQQLARELGRVRGVGAMLATAGDLQIALRRTQDAPTQPVEIQFT